MATDRTGVTREDAELFSNASSVGAKGAALVLSKMIGTEIDVSFPDFEVIRLEDLTKSELYKNQIVSFVFSRFHGDIDGTAAILFPSDSTHTILKALYNRDVPSLTELEQIDFSILKETGNILIGSFLNALCDTFDLTVLPAVPDVAVDDINAVFDSFSVVLSLKNRDNIISVKTEMYTGPKSRTIFGVMLIFFGPSVDAKSLFRPDR
ncbi:hypothetical protein DRQ36_08930 [bacterium]|nr:MAG: hypothetical protein DRQ36_08930 [bacterium]